MPKLPEGDPQTGFGLDPVRVASASAIDWDETTDVLIVGFGGAGGCAALQAKEYGAQVLLIDRFGGGGTTTYSGGVIYAGGTRYQTEAGLSDDAENLNAYLAEEVGDAVKPETLRRFCEGSGADVDWLVSQGVEYASTVYQDKVAFPPEGYYIYYTGHEQSPRFRAKARPVPRGHRPVGAGFGGQHFIAALSKAVARSGVDFRPHTKASRLIVDADGDVIGVELLSVPAELHQAHQRLYLKTSPWIPHAHARKNRAVDEAVMMEQRYGRSSRVRVTGGVVLATGGFAYNQTMLQESDPAFAQYYGVVHRLATAGSDGSGIRLGQSVGGAVDRMDRIYVARHVAPPPFVWGILLNREGKRFVNEDAYISVIGEAIAAQTNAEGWLVLPAHRFWNGLRKALSQGWHAFKYYTLPLFANILFGGTRTAKDNDALAGKMGFDPTTLRATIDTYNQAIQSDRPDAFGKAETFRDVLRDGRYFAINLSVSNPHALTPFMTLGGLVVDEESGLVRRTGGTTINGLYAAGTCAVGLCSNGYISGLSIADGVFAGRRAGRSAAAARLQRRTASPNATCS